MQNLNPTSAAGSQEPTLALPHRFQPKVTRVWAYAIGALACAASVVLAWIVPGERTLIIDRVGILAFGLVILWFCHRQASVCVLADATTVTVRNLFSTSAYSWPELFAVSFPDGDPWAHLDLANGETVSTMALQRADGAYGVEQARALNALILEHGTAAAPSVNSAS